MNAGAWLDRLTEPIAPRWTFRRQRARMAAEMLVRNFEAASSGRRTQGWRRPSSDVNAAIGGALGLLRNAARDITRNNPYAESALSTIVDHVVGWGIVAKAAGPTSKSIRVRADAAWKPWAETTACDADGRHDLAGLQKLVMRTVAESGEALIRRRWRRPEDELPIPMQLQILEPDFLDSSKDGMLTATGGRIIQGVEFDPIGRRVAYWMFSEHPGASIAGLGFSASTRIPASEILHVFKSSRPGQVRGFSWFAPVLLKMKDFDEYEDAALMKQKIAACLAVITSDIDGTAPALGATSTDKPGIDSLEPGMILNAAPGRTVTVVDPPTISEHAEYAKTVLQAIATGIGITYEDLTGSYEGMPFSAARMSRLRHGARIEDWRWRMLIPQFCDPVWGWAMQAAGIMGLPESPAAEWTAPPMAMVDPAAEGLAYQRNIRTGIVTWSEAVRERGYDPDDVLAEMAEDNKKFDALGIILDSDARKMTQAGQLQGTAAPELPAPAPATPASSPNDPTRNGHGDGDLARAFALLERALSQRVPAQDIRIENHPPAQAPAPNVTVGAPNMTIERGAIHAEIHAAPAPDVHIDAPVTISPAAVTIAEGAIRSEVTVQPPPPAAVTIEGATVNVAPAEVHIDKGAIRAEMHAPDVLVEAPVVTIEKGAVQVSAPVTVEAPAPVAMRVRKRVKRGKDGIEGTTEIHTPITEPEADVGADEP